MSTKLPFRRDDGQHLAFGMHRGKAPADVPTSYLRWLLLNCTLSARLADVVHEELLSRGEVITPWPKQPAAEIRCRRCGGGVLASWVEDAAGRSIIRADCRGCEQFVRFLAQTQENIALANAAESQAVGEEKPEGEHRR